MRLIRHLSSLGAVVGDTIAASTPGEARMKIRRFPTRLERQSRPTCHAGATSTLIALMLWLGGGAMATQATPQMLALIPEAMPGAPPLPTPLRERLALDLAARGKDYVPRTKNVREDGSPIYSNRLLLEASPYLQQHAHNPVDWYPWGDEAFATAKRLGRPVLVSIGYSTCHWCHVMEEETFDDVEVVRFLNQHFIAIKVDREARPDIDSIYMSAIHSMGQQGGWPLNVWVTAEGKPFFGGTYFPPKDSRGRPSFSNVLRAIYSQYKENRKEVDETAQKISNTLQRNLEGVSATASQVPSYSALTAAKDAYSRSIDRTWGGLGYRTKFPSSLPIRFLLRYHRTTGDADALAMATLTLEKMAAGGIHDHVGGGFHRYSTERRWLIPHFEKMLYDNALLAMAYLEAGLLTGRSDFTSIARSILDYVGREMTSTGGGFYSATDADSISDSGEAKEGWFFTWTSAELQAALGEALTEVVTAYYGVTPGGTYEGRNILHAWREPGVVADELGMTRKALEQRLASARKKLYSTRSRRTAPLRDGKILVGWNGLMISAFAQAGFALNDPGYTDRGQAAARYILDEMRVEGRLRRVSLDGKVAGPAFLEDHAFLIAGLLDLYEADPDPRWVREAIGLQAALDSRYADTAGGGYYTTAADGERLLTREKPGQDGALPSGNSIEAMNLLRLADLTGDESYRETAGMIFSAFYDSLAAKPTGVSEMMLALDYHLENARQIVLVQPTQGGDPEAMLRPLRSTFLPNRVVSIVREGVDLGAHAKLVPLVKGKTAQDGEVTAYVCKNRVCRYPTSDPKVFAKQLV